MDNPTSEQGFRVGEVAIYWRPEASEHGMEVTIAGPLTWDRGSDFDRITGCRVGCPGHPVKELSPNGYLWIISPHFLRKKRPPREDLRVVLWDQCPWQPETIHV